MCGIAGVTRLRNTAISRLDALCGELLVGIEPRGRDAAGQAVVYDEGFVKVHKASCAARDFNVERRIIPDDARTVLLHTRFATNGSPAFPENNHPVDHGSIFAVHNGVISNDRELFRELDIRPQSNVDSEIVPTLIHEVGWDNYREALERLEGTFALAVVNEEVPDEVLLVRGNASPLCYVKTADFLIWASTPSAVHEAWGKILGTPPSYKKIHTVDEGTIIRVKRGNITTSSFEPRKLYTKYKATWTDNGLCHLPTTTNPEQGVVVTKPAKDTATKKSGIVVVQPKQKYPPEGYRLVCAIGGYELVPQRDEAGKPVVEVEQPDIDEATMKALDEGDEEYLAGLKLGECALCHIDLTALDESEGQVEEVDDTLLCTPCAEFIRKAGW